MVRDSRSIGAPGGPATSRAGVTGYGPATVKTPDGSAVAGASGTGRGPATVINLVSSDDDSGLVGLAEGSGRGVSPRVYDNGEGSSATGTKRARRRPVILTSDSEDESGIESLRQDAPEDVVRANETLVEDAPGDAADREEVTDAAGGGPIDVDAALAEEDAAADDDSDAYVSDAVDVEEVEEAPKASKGS